MSTHDAFSAFEHAGWTDKSLARAYHGQLADVTRQSIPRLLAAAGVKPGDRVLDVACGGGYVAAAARDQGAEAVGLDFSATQVRLAKQAYPGIEFAEGDAEALPFSGVIQCGCGHSSPNKRSLQRLKRGGSTVTKVPLSSPHALMPGSRTYSSRGASLHELPLLAGMHLS